MDIPPEYLKKAAEALEAFGISLEDLDRLADFDGDITCGPVQEGEES